jgi:hypothetical protein
MMFGRSHSRFQQQRARLAPECTYTLHRGHARETYLLWRISQWIAAHSRCVSWYHPILSCTQRQEMENRDFAVKWRRYKTMSTLHFRSGDPDFFDLKTMFARDCARARVHGEILAPPQAQRVLPRPSHRVRPHRRPSCFLFFAPRLFLARFALISIIAFVALHLGLSGIYPTSSTSSCPFSCGLMVYTAAYCVPSNYLLLTIYKRITTVRGKRR